MRPRPMQARFTRPLQIARREGLLLLRCLCLLALALPAGECTHVIWQYYCDAMLLRIGVSGWLA